MITQDEVISQTARLPGFPRIICEILATLDDPEANLNTLANHIALDPVIAARVLSLANKASQRTRHLAAIRDIYTATSLIGMGRVREMALISSIGGFVNGMAAAAMPAAFWQHSVAVGVCSHELALYVAAPTSTDTALIAGLLHDVGQLWLYCFYPEAFRASWSQALTHATGIEIAEREHFGVDHSQIGTWLAEHWELPLNIVAAIRHHHMPDAALDDALVPLVHIAEVLSNALDLTGRSENRVTSISSAACTRLDIVWDEHVQALFGRMEARSRHANAMFS
jgi:HD-like signal output (HDOD) protein